jgi:nucleotide-binding universal stress UspA family protein
MTTRNILVPMDGSRAALRALEYAARRFRDSDNTCLLLLNVQSRLPSSRTVTKTMIAEYHERQAKDALAPARALVEKLGSMTQFYSRLGDPATEIAAFAKRTRCAEIIMGTRGLGRVSGMLLGSVAQKVISLAHVPVVLVK